MGCPVPGGLPGGMPAGNGGMFGPGLAWPGPSPLRTPLAPPTWGEPQYTDPRWAIPATGGRSLPPAVRLPTPAVAPTHPPKDRNGLQGGSRTTPVASTGAPAAPATRPGAREAPSVPSSSLPGSLPSLPPPEHFGIHLPPTSAAVAPAPAHAPETSLPSLPSLPPPEHFGIRLSKGQP